jgi:hypothetical protein
MTTASLDLASLDTQAAAEAGAFVALDDPRTNEPLVDDDGKAYGIEIIGLDSPKLRAIARKITDRNITNIRRGKRVDYDSEVAEGEKVELYAAATKSWYLPPLAGEVLECNERNARRLYADPRFPWIVEKIDRDIADRQRFFKSASPS